MAILPCLTMLALLAQAVESKPVLGKPIKAVHDFVTTTSWKIEPEPGGPPIRGRLTISCYADDRDEFKLELAGLTPRSVHTVWFATSLKETAVRGGVGKPPYQNKSTGGGNLGLQCLVEKCPLSEWKWLEVRLHPDGDPTHMDGSVRVVKVRLLAQ